MRYAVSLDAVFLCCVHPILQWGPNLVVACSLEEVAEIIMLPDFDKRAARRQRDNKDVEVPAIVMSQLKDFITAIADLYNDNPFHSEFDAM